MPCIYFLINNCIIYLEREVLLKKKKERGGAILYFQISHVRWSTFLSKRRRRSCYFIYKKSRVHWMPLPFWKRSSFFLSSFFIKSIPIFLSFFKKKNKKGDGPIGGASHFQGFIQAVVFLFFWEIRKLHCRARSLSPPGTVGHTQRKSWTSKWEQNGIQNLLFI